MEKSSNFVSYPNIEILKLLNKKVLNEINQQIMHIVSTLPLDNLSKIFINFSNFVSQLMEGCMVLPLVFCLSIMGLRSTPKLGIVEQTTSLWMTKMFTWETTSFGKEIFLEFLNDRKTMLFKYATLNLEQNPFTVKQSEEGNLLRCWSFTQVYFYGPVWFQYQPNFCTCLEQV